MLNQSESRSIRRSVLALALGKRVSAVTVLIIALWLAIVWAESLQ
jgi:hypothetical protein